MARIKSTAGQILINEALPEELRDYSRVLDKSSAQKLLSYVAVNYPEKYRDISHKLLLLGRDSSYYSGGNSFGLRHMRRAAIARQRRMELQKEIDKYLDDDNLTDKQRNERIIKAASKLMQTQGDEIFDESFNENNPLAMQVASGSRGNRMNLASLRGSDLLYQDNRGEIIPVPVMRSYSQGLSPAEYWAGTYGARAGLTAVKFATQDAGYLSKVLHQVAHRLLVTGLDEEEKEGIAKTLQGLPVATDDPDNEGALLASDVGGYKRNTVITQKILADLRDQDVKRILVRSPIVRGAPDGGLYARDAGVREFGRLPTNGENVGLIAAAALSEPVSQGQLSAKHGGGVAGAAKAVSGFAALEQLIQVPKTFQGGATHATLDGVVQNIVPAPAGGSFITVNGEQHFVPPDIAIKVKKGDRVEAGDMLSEGEPNPALITKYKGIGEGRRYFINAYRSALKSANIGANRRNIEVLARGLINHVRMTDESGDFVTDDIIPYSVIEHSYQPRDGFKNVDPRQAIGKYLERPYLHYSIGTKVKPSMLKDFNEFGVNKIDVHDEEPPFEPEMIRGLANLHYDSDPITRLAGSGLKGSILNIAHRGGVSDVTGTSFVPSRIRAVDFGLVGKVKTPEKPTSEHFVLKPTKPGVLI